MAGSILENQPNSRASASPSDEQHLCRRFQDLGLRRDWISISDGTNASWPSHGVRLVPNPTGFDGIAGNGSRNNSQLDHGVSLIPKSLPGFGATTSPPNHGVGLILNPYASRTQQEGVKVPPIPSCQRPLSFCPSIAPNNNPAYHNFGPRDSQFDMGSGITFGSYANNYSLTYENNFGNLDTEGRSPASSIHGGGDNVVIELAKTLEGSQYLQALLLSKENGDNKHTLCILARVFGYLHALMIDEYGHYLFERLVEACKDANLMKRIMAEIFSEPDALIVVAFNKYGSSSIQKLIKLLKRSQLAFFLTSILSTKLYELMIDRIGRRVVGHCFTVFDDEKNKVLYEQVIEHCLELATDSVGCRSLNECINTISGPHRDILLNKITDQSVCLSYHPSGNFVVQHVLGLHNPYFTKKICTKLRTNFARLSFLKNGSHVAEQCLTSSDQGMKYVVSELVRSKELKRLARDPFGNYVIQTALKITKGANSELYKSLTKALEPFSSTLEHNKIGQKVLKLIGSLRGSVSEKS